MGSPRYVYNRRRRTREGPDPACVQTPFVVRGGTCRRDGRINVRPWYRLVGVAKTSSDARRKNRAARKGKWSPRGTGKRQAPPVLECAQVKGKAGENGQHWGEIGGSSPWTRPSAPRCGDTLKALASDQHLI